MFKIGVSMTDTKDSILDAAERLFAERGFDATSLRAITSTAGVNLAAVNYHFQSKEKLVQALFLRTLGRLNRRRMEMMDLYEVEYGQKPIPLEKLVNVFIEPMFDSPADHPDGRNTFGILIGRMYSSPRSSLDNILLADIRNFAERFENAIRKTLPDIPLEDLFWRTFFALGSAVHTLASTHILQQISRGLCDSQDREAALRKLTAFIVAGLKTSANVGKSVRHPPKSVKNLKGK
jgi:AcrR family transcriptional regulator